MEPTNDSQDDIGPKPVQGKDLTLEFILIAAIAAICIVLFAIYIKLAKNEVE